MVRELSALFGIPTEILTQPYAIRTAA